MTDYEAIKDKVDALLAEANIIYKVEFVGVGFDERHGYNDKPWEHDLWRVAFKLKPDWQGFSKTTMTTDYRTGVGHRALPRAGMSFSSFKKDEKGRLISAKRADNAFERRQQELGAKPVPPRAADVLYSLVLDAEALNTSFHYWCDELGYDRDSINALNTYNLCCENGEKIRKVFDHKTLAAVQELVREL